MDENSSEDECWVLLIRRLKLSLHQKIHWAGPSSGQSDHHNNTVIFILLIIHVDFVMIWFVSLPHKVSESSMWVSMTLAAVVAEKVSQCSWPKTCFVVNQRQPLTYQFNKAHALFWSGALFLISVSWLRHYKYTHSSPTCQFLIAVVRKTQEDVVRPCVPFEHLQRKTSHSTLLVNQRLQGFKAFI